MTWGPVPQDYLNLGATEMIQIHIKAENLILPQRLHVTLVCHRNEFWMLTKSKQFVLADLFFPNCDPT